MKKGNNDGFAVVHLWQPEQWHDRQHIVGNKEGLRRLADIINVAISTGTSCRTEVSTSDGEGYDLDVQIVEDKDLVTLAVPYTDEIAAEKRENAVYPWSD